MHTASDSKKSIGTRQAAMSNYRLTIRGVLAFSVLCGITFGVFQILATYSSIVAEGVYGFSEQIVTLVFLPVFFGLVFCVIGLAIAFFVGRIKNSRSVAFIGFWIGVLFLPAAWILIVGLISLGVLADT